MKAKIMVVGLALVGTIVAAQAGGVPGTAHADVSIFAKGRCYICMALAPSIQISSTQLYESDTFYTFTVGVAGSRFPQGDPVHIDLVYTLPDGITTPDGAPLPAGPYTVASTDTQASYERIYPLGNGQVVHVEAGHVSAILTSVPVCTNLDTPTYTFQVIATDMATGKSYATIPSDMPATPCNSLRMVSY